MTQLDQLGGIPVQGGDRWVKNYSGSDIAANLFVIRDTTNVPDASGTSLGVSLPASDVGVFGVTLTVIPAGGYGRVRTMGVAVVIAAATLHVGDAIMCNSAGKAIARTTTKVFAGAAESEAVSTDLMQVNLNGCGTQTN